MVVSHSHMGDAYTYIIVLIIVFLVVCVGKSLGKTEGAGRFCSSMQSYKTILKSSLLGSGTIFLLVRQPGRSWRQLPGWPPDFLLEFPAWFSVSGLANKHIRVRGGFPSIQNHSERSSRGFVSLGAVLACCGCVWRLRLALATRICDCDGSELKAVSSEL